MSKQHKSWGYEKQGEYDTYYHYTDKQGASAIKKSKKIRSSTSSTTRDDAAFGDGVYLTKMNPYHNSKDQIAKNNWDTSSSFYENQVHQGRVDRVVKVQIPKTDAPKRVSDHRSVYLYGGNLNLKRYPSKIEKVNQN